jgi:Flp pilus assembly protein TadG
MRVRGRIRQRGSTAIEFALVFPIFFTLIACALEGGRFVVSRMMLAYAVTVGARAATLSNATTGSVETAVVNAAPMLHLATTQVEITTGGTPATLPLAVGTAVTVSVGMGALNAGHKYQFKSIIPVKISPFSTRSWSAQATMTTR